MMTSFCLDKFVFVYYGFPVVPNWESLVKLAYTLRIYK